MSVCPVCIWSYNCLYPFIIVCVCAFLCIHAGVVLFFCTNEHSSNMSSRGTPAPRFQVAQRCFISSPLLTKQSHIRFLTLSVSLSLDTIHRRHRHWARLTFKNPYEAWWTEIEAHGLPTSDHEQRGLNKKAPKVIGVTCLLCGLLIEMNAFRFVLNITFEPAWLLFQESVCLFSSQHFLHNDA